MEVNVNNSPAETFGMPHSLTSAEVGTSPIKMSQGSSSPVRVTKMQSNDDIVTSQNSTEF